MTGFIQQSLSFSRHLLLFFLVVASWPFLRERPSFRGVPDVDLTVKLAAVPQASPDGWRLHGAWSLSADDLRLAGLSGLDCAEGALEMSTDIGGLVTMAFPVPGDQRLRAHVAHRAGYDEGEALIARGGRRVVAQENRSELMVFEPDGSTRSIAIPRPRLHPNLGIEALVEDRDGGWLAFEEAGRRAFRIRGDSVQALEVRGASGMITGAARGPGGRSYLLGRTVGPIGFSARLSQMVDEGEIIHVGPPVSLPLPFNANAEGLCVEPRGAGGSTRLWVVSDDNGLPVMAQRLVAWDVPDDAWPSAPEGADD